jgi:TPR repeat protein
MFNKFDSLNTNNSLYEFSQNFNKLNIKEIEPTIKNINKNIFDGDLILVIDNLVDFIFNELNKGVYKEIVKRNFLNYMSNHEIISQVIYNYLLNNQNNPNSIYLLGYFNYYGIEVSINKQKAFKLYQQAMELKNYVAQLDLAEMYIHGDGVVKNYNKAYELTKNLAKEGFPNAINKLGYCHEKGIGTSMNKQKAFKFYQKAADLGNSTGMNNLGSFYYCGIGTDINKQKGFELFQKAANLENDLAQYNLALKYENGDGVKKDMDKAIYWYKRSAGQGHQFALYKLKGLTKK